MGVNGRREAFEQRTTVANIRARVVDKQICRRRNLDATGQILTLQFCHGPPSRSGTFCTTYHTDLWEGKTHQVEVAALENAAEELVEGPDIEEILETLQILCLLCP